MRDGGLFLFLFLAQVEMNLLELLSIGNRDPVILIGILTLAMSLDQSRPVWRIVQEWLAENVASGSPEGFAFSN